MALKTAKAPLKIEEVGSTFNRESLLVVYGNAAALAKEHGGKYRRMPAKEFEQLRAKLAGGMARMLALHDPEIDAAIVKYKKKDKEDTNRLENNIQLALSNPLVKDAIRQINKENKEAKSYTRLVVEWEINDYLKGLSKVATGAGIGALAGLPEGGIGAGPGALIGAFAALAVGCGNETETAGPKETNIGKFVPEVTGRIKAETNQALNQLDLISVQPYSLGGEPIATDFLVNENGEQKSIANSTNSFFFSIQGPNDVFQTNGRSFSNFMVVLTDTGKADQTNSEIYKSDTYIPTDKGYFIKVDGDITIDQSKLKYKMPIDVFNSSFKYDEFIGTSFSGWGPAQGSVDNFLSGLKNAVPTDSDSYREIKKLLKDVKGLTAAFIDQPYVAENGYLYLRFESSSKKGQIDEYFSPGEALMIYLLHQSKGITENDLLPGTYKDVTELLNASLRGGMGQSLWMFLDPNRLPFHRRNAVTTGTILAEIGFDKYFDACLHPDKEGLIDALSSKIGVNMVPDYIYRTSLLHTGQGDISEVENYEPNNLRIFLAAKENNALSPYLAEHMPKINGVDLKDANIKNEIDYVKMAIANSARDFVEFHDQNEQKDVRTAIHSVNANYGSYINVLQSLNPADVQQKIRQLLKPVDAHPLVVDMRSMRGLEWQVG